MNNYVTQYMHLKTVNCSCSSSSGSSRAFKNKAYSKYISTANAITILKFVLHMEEYSYRIDEGCTGTIIIIN